MLSSHAPLFLILNWFMAYFPFHRLLKLYHGLDHNRAPRYDTAKYGPAAVAAGKMTKKQLERVLRWESAHANGLENFTFFVAAVLMGLLGGVDGTTMDRLMGCYTLARVAFAVSYVVTESEKLSWVRTAFFFVGNFCNLGMIWLAWKGMPVWSGEMEFKEVVVVR